MDPNNLAERYSSMQTEELVALHSSGTLIDDAYPILEAEMGRRGVANRPRPEPPVPEAQLSFFSDHWSGRQPSGSANAFVAAWVPALLGGAMLMTYRLAGYLAPDSRVVPLLPRIFASIMVAYLVFATVAVWRCARNHDSVISTSWARFKGLRMIAIFALGVYLVFSGKV